MLSDIEIAQQAKMQKITDVAAKLGISEDDIELYGKYKAKLSYDLIRRVKDKKDGKLILVTAITPTPAGEGKSTTTVGLAQGLAKLGKKVIVALREPSLDRKSTRLNSVTCQNLVCRLLLEKKKKTE